MVICCWHRLLNIRSVCVRIAGCLYDHLRLLLWKLVSYVDSFNRMPESFKWVHRKLLIIKTVIYWSIKHLPFNRILIKVIEEDIDGSQQKILYFYLCKVWKWASRKAAVSLLQKSKVQSQALGRLCSIVVHREFLPPYHDVVLIRYGHLQAEDERIPA